ncbi:3-oxoacyl-ACP synthase [Streptomyces sp. P38-E01]|uniref:3-oxoacyl-ACP synthase n=2 Tax=Streptomyces tardus TaxID=2780544 RepID=A0A949JE48_9ACTN|nr:3-oxoacyl-ACP synthase [Streptomyces tardus]
MMITVTGVGVAMPGVESAAELAAASGPQGTVDPKEILGKKGLRYKDRATQLGLCAALRTVTDAGLHADGELTVEGTRVAVLVSTNLGNVDTVCRVAKTISEEGTYGVSPMDTPNASSNITASEIAIKYGFKGPNLTLCNGPTSGLDAVRWATALLRADRADQVVVVGVEPDNEIVRSLVGGPVADGAAGLVLERAESARERGSKVRAVIGAHTRSSDLATGVGELAETETEKPAAFFAPGTAADELIPGPPRHDLAAAWGELSGALGIVQCAAAVGALESGTDGPVWLVAGSDSDDGVATLVLHHPSRADVELVAH